MQQKFQIQQCYIPYQTRLRAQVVWRKFHVRGREQSKISPKISLSSPKSSTYDGVSRGLDWSDSMGSDDRGGEVIEPIVGVRGYRHP
jgi:hypothetical protein